MLTSVLLCVALAALIWPVPPDPVARLLPPRRRWSASNRLPAKKFAALALLPLIPVLGPAGAIAVGLMAAAVRWQRTTRQRTRTRIATANAMAEALRTLVAELRSGASPITAAEAAAVDAPPDVAAAMRSLAAAARYGDDVVLTDGGRHQAKPPPHERLAKPKRQSVDLTVHRHLAKAWLLSRRHGLPLAELLDAVRRDIAAEGRFLARADAHMSGPRASATVLATLPALGILLGQAIGANPLHVLTGTTLGQLLLVTGGALILAGIAWSARLTRLEAHR
ncbi:hypothetical protein HFP15_40320 [Amycolatopsis sp. K13G38]|uniref:Type II secretion system protein GspF domain-containing protein n=1 Tax=Amycolatopsis acididurans TaxID=2724524 RepID=A0ABX1JHN3_9PSEU|nr:hypothetical protein [Amycolatopsis acididurans]NKQ59108.1 hypothetical protein [Amycolatopsis acididurans]